LIEVFGLDFWQCLNKKGNKRSSMNTEMKLMGTSRIHRLLMFFVVVNIIGELGTIAFWYGSPSSRVSLLPSILGTSIGNDSVTLAVGSALTALVAVVYIVSLLGLTKRQKWGPLMVIAISIVNRALALVIYQISAAFVFWLVWTIILLGFAYLDFRQIKEHPSMPSASNSQP
jgi:hypothetical protein